MAGRFALPSDAYWALVGLQKSAYSDALDVRFTVNLTAIPRQVWQAQREQNPHLPQSPSPGVLYGSWAPQTRLGGLLPDGQGDTWWRVVPGGDHDAVADDVLEKLRDHGLPRLRQQMRGQVP